MPTVGIPTVDLVYNLGDVATSTSNWFSSIWLIVAFSVAIPLAFYVAGRVKGMFA
jgi:hypothetical protein